MFKGTNSKKGVLFIKLLSTILGTAYLTTVGLSGVALGAEIENLGPEIRNTISTYGENRFDLFAYYLSGGQAINEDIVEIYESEEPVSDISEENTEVNNRRLLEESEDSIVESIEEVDEENTGEQLEEDIDWQEEITYNPENLREVSNLSEMQIFNILEGSNLQVLSQDYYEMEEKYNINALFLMALNSEESGHGTSMLAVNNNNIGGVKTIDGGWASFGSWEESLEFIAALIDIKYLTEDGPYYNGTSIYDVNIRYCEGTQWAKNLNKIAYEFLERAQLEK